MDRADHQGVWRPRSRPPRDELSDGVRLGRGMVISLFGMAAIAACSSPAALESTPSCSPFLGEAAVVLESDSTGEYADPGTQVAIDSKGTFYGGSLQGGKLLKWAADGRLLASVGRVGQGPGEFAPGPLRVFVSPDDTVFVRDGSLRFSVFDTALAFIRTVPLGPIMAMSAGETHFLEDGRIASTFQSPRFQGSDLVFLDREGRVLASELPTQDELNPGGFRPNRPSGVVRSGALWVGPPYGMGGYSFDIVDSLGKITSRFSPPAPWFDVGTRVEKAEAHGPARRFPFPAVSRVQADEHGLVWIWTALPRDRAAVDMFLRAPIQDLARVTREVTRTRIEVYDPDTRELQAAGELQVPIADVLEPIFHGRQVLVVEVDSTGARNVSVRSMQLRGMGGEVCSAISRR